MADVDHGRGDEAAEGSGPRRGWIRRPQLVWPLGLYVVLRVPSWFEPHWYTDEAGYATTAWQTLHGAVLYLTAWNNKPPVLFWIYDLALTLFGPSELGLHLLSTVAGLLAMVALWMLMRQRLTPRRVAIGMVVAAFLLGTPILNGDLALPEDFLIAPTAWAMVLVLWSLRAKGRDADLAAVGAGVLLAGACLIQQTALADVAAVLMVLVFAPGRRGWRAAAMLVAAGLITGAAVLTPYVVAAGFHNVYFYLVGSYLGYANSSLQPSLLSLGPRVLALLLLPVGAWALRRSSVQTELLWVWLATLLVVYALPNRPYVHFLLPAVVPFSAVVAGSSWRWFKRLWSRSRSELAARVPIAGAVLVGAALWGVLLVSGLGGGSLFTAKLALESYPMFVGRALGTVSATSYLDLYDTRAVAERQAVSYVKAHGLEGSTAVVWSPDAWAYLLGHLRPILPVPPIYMDQLWLGTSALISRVEHQKPLVVIVTNDSLTEYGPIEPLLHRSYTEVGRYSSGQLWVLERVAARLSSRRSTTESHPLRLHG